MDFGSGGGLGGPFTPHAETKYPIKIIRNITLINFLIIYFTPYELFKLLILQNKNQPKGFNQTQKRKAR